jgi:hypothetical protein
MKRTLEFPVLAGNRAAAGQSTKDLEAARRFVQQGTRQACFGV